MQQYLILNGHIESALLYKKQSTHKVSSLLLNYFNIGDSINFFKLYQLLHTDPRLQFYLRVYFLVSTLQKSSNNLEINTMNEQMVRFKEYLENKGAQLAKTNQFLEFYALAYIKKPMQHAAFKPLFKKEWSQVLRDRLQNFINTQMRRLHQQVRNFLSQHKSPIKNEQNDIKYKQDILEMKYKTVWQTYQQNLRQFQSKSFEMIKQLISSCKTLLKYAKQRGEQFQDIRITIQKYQKMINKRIFQCRMETEQKSELIQNNQQKNSEKIIKNQQIKKIQQNYVITQYIPTDFHKIKQQLFQSSNSLSNKIDIIKGLIHRIIWSVDNLVRRQQIIGIVGWDVFCIREGDQVKQLLCNKQNISQNQQGINQISSHLSRYRKKRRMNIITNVNISNIKSQYMCELLYNLSDDYYARSVLFANGVIIKYLVLLLEKIVLFHQNLQNILYNQQHKEQKRIFNFLIGIFSRLCLRQQLRLQMIGVDLINLCQKVLQQSVIKYLQDNQVIIVNNLNILVYLYSENIQKLNMSKLKQRNLGILLKIIEQNYPYVIKLKVIQIFKILTQNQKFINTIKQMKVQQNFKQLIQQQKNKQNQQKYAKYYINQLKIVLSKVFTKNHTLISETQLNDQDNLLFAINKQIPDKNYKQQHLKLLQSFKLDQNKSHHQLAQVRDIFSQIVLSLRSKQQKNNIKHKNDNPSKKGEVQRYQYQHSQSIISNNKKNINQTKYNKNKESKPVTPQQNNIPQNNYFSFNNINANIQKIANVSQKKQKIINMNQQPTSMANFTEQTPGFRPHNQKRGDEALKKLNLQIRAQRQYQYQMSNKKQKIQNDDIQRGQSGKKMISLLNNDSIRNYDSMGDLLKLKKGHFQKQIEDNNQRQERISKQKNKSKISILSKIQDQYEYKMAFSPKPKIRRSPPK